MTDRDKQALGKEIQEHEREIGRRIDDFAKATEGHEARLQRLRAHHYRETGVDRGPTPARHPPSDPQVTPEVAPKVTREDAPKRPGRPKK